MCLLPRTASQPGRRAQADRVGSFILRFEKASPVAQNQRRKTGDKLTDQRK